MRILGRLLVPLLLVGACATEGYIVTESVPAARVEAAVYRPGYIWVNGHWARDHGRWRWNDGRYERERPGHVYIEGRWQRNGDGHVWVEGGWRRRDNVVVRDHR
jgi:hypothetical protein